MSTVLHYRDHQKAVDRWSNMERVRLIAQQMADEHERAYGIADTAPCELSYGHQDGDVA